MSFKDELKAQVASIFKDNWTKRDGTVVPETGDLQLGNDAVELQATVLYADMKGSTKLVDGQKAHLAAEVYKAYLHCAAKVIRSEGGEITAYDGDRIMAVFIGSSKNTSAVRSALKINYCVKNILNPAFKAQYPSSSYELRQTVGVDTSKLFVARTGIRGANDLVWVGRAANYAAKLTELDEDSPTWITGAVYDGMHESAKVTDGKAMWTKMSWTTMNKMDIYRSTWWWGV